jgi:hypothetical protein
VFPERAVAAVLLRIAAGDDIVEHTTAASRSSVAVMRAACVGESTPGRPATRNLRRSVNGASAEARSQESSQARPVGISTPSLPIGGERNLFEMGKVPGALGRHAFRRLFRSAPGSPHIRFRSDLRLRHILRRRPADGAALTDKVHATSRFGSINSWKAREGTASE